MTTVNSLSGGKTSSYIAMNYPADYNLFALVCIDDHNAMGPLKKDKKLVQMINDKLHPYCKEYGEFVATAEDPKVLKAMFDLEQMMGKEITWLRGHDFGSLIQKHKHSIPNKFKRWCTSEMKVMPIFRFLHMKGALPCEMRIGFRYDEQERSINFRDTIKYPYMCNTYGKQHQKWQEIVWRVGNFPLIEDKIMHKDIQDYWKNKSIVFPEDSNCQNCFWKQPQQLRKNFDTNPAIMSWAGVMEAIMDRKWQKDSTYFEISKLGLQQEFNFGTGSGCQAGFCTD